MKKLAITIFAILFMGAMSFAGSKAKKAQSSSASKTATKTYYGVVSDSHCGLKHSVASAAAHACVEKCVAGGASYALVYHGRLYKLDPQDKFKGLGGDRVKVAGLMSNGTITAETVTKLAAHPMRKRMKKSS